MPIVELVARMLSKRPDDRPANAALVATALEPFCSAADVDEEINALAQVELRPNFLEWVGSLEVFEQIDDIPPVETDPALLDFMQAMTGE
jgi:hypothetical protein